MSDSIKVYARTRPPNAQESRESCVSLSSDRKTITLAPPNSSGSNLSASLANVRSQPRSSWVSSSNTPSAQSFSFDGVYDHTTSQANLYHQVAEPLLLDVMKGFNATILAYGQTGSGKTYTMSGYDNNNEPITETSLHGIIPRLFHGLFQHIEDSDESCEFTIKVSIYEIYLEKIRDLLATTTVNNSNESSSDNLRLRDDGNAVWIEDLTQVYVTSVEELLSVLQAGQIQRSVSSTNMNEQSSRSHLLVQVTIGQNNTETAEKIGSQLTLVDLAGSEKVAKTQAKNHTLKEAQHINKSLSMLGNVINACSSKMPHIPYRDSKLTHILRDSLGGNSKTVLLIACSPAIQNLEESISTCRFGQRASTIRNTPIVNRERSAEEYRRIIVTTFRLICYRYALVYQAHNALTYCIDHFLPDDLDSFEHGNENYDLVLSAQNDTDCQNNTNLQIATTLLTALSEIADPVNDKDLLQFVDALKNGTIHSYLASISPNNTTTTASKNLVVPTTSAATPLQNARSTTSGSPSALGAASPASYASFSQFSIGAGASPPPISHIAGASSNNNNINPNQTMNSTTPQNGKQTQQQQQQSSNASFMHSSRAGPPKNPTGSTESVLDIVLPADLTQLDVKSLPNFDEAILKKLESYKARNEAMIETLKSAETAHGLRVLEYIGVVEEKEQRLVSLQTELNDLYIQEQTLREQVESFQTTRDNYEREKASFQKEIAALNQQLENFTSLLKTKDTNIKTLHEEACTRQDQESRREANLHRNIEKWHSMSDKAQKQAQEATAQLKIQQNTIIANEKKISELTTQKEQLAATNKQNQQLYKTTLSQLKDKIQQLNVVQDELSSKNKHIELIQNEIATNKQTIETLKKTIDDCHNTVVRQSEENVKIQQLYDELQHKMEISTSDENVSILKQEIARLTKLLTNEQQAREVSKLQVNQMQLSSQKLHVQNEALEKEQTILKSRLHDVDGQLSDRSSRMNDLLKENELLRQQLRQLANGSDSSSTPLSPKKMPTSPSVSSANSSISLDLTGIPSDTLTLQTRLVALQTKYDTLSTKYARLEDLSQERFVDLEREKQHVQYVSSNLQRDFEEKTVKLNELSLVKEDLTNKLRESHLLQEECQEKNRVLEDKYKALQQTKNTHLVELTSLRNTYNAMKQTTQQTIATITNEKLSLEQQLRDSTMICSSAQNELALLKEMSTDKEEQLKSTIQTIEDEKTQLSRQLEVLTETLNHTQTECENKIVSLQLSFETSQLAYQQLDEEYTMFKQSHQKDISYLEEKLAVQEKNALHEQQLHENLTTQQDRLFSEQQAALQSTIKELRNDLDVLNTELRKSQEEVNMIKSTTNETLSIQNKQFNAQLLDLRDKNHREIKSLQSKHSALASKHTELEQQCLQLQDLTSSQQDEIVQLEQQIKRAQSKIHHLEVQWEQNVLTQIPFEEELQTRIQFLEQQLLQYTGGSTIPSLSQETGGIIAVAPSSDLHHAHSGNHPSTTGSKTSATKQSKEGGSTSFFSWASGTAKPSNSSSIGPEQLYAQINLLQNEVKSTRELIAKKEQQLERVQNTFLEKVKECQELQDEKAALEYQLEQSLLDVEQLHGYLDDPEAIISLRAHCKELEQELSKLRDANKNLLLNDYSQRKKNGIVVPHHTNTNASTSIIGSLQPNMSYFGANNNTDDPVVNVVNTTNNNNNNNHYEPTNNESDLPVRHNNEFQAPSGSTGSGLFQQLQQQQQQQHQYSNQSDTATPAIALGRGESAATQQQQPNQMFFSHVGSVNLQNEQGFRKYF